MDSADHVCHFVFIFFFFKQKTAYEMRISDWSSDVCSSDLTAPRDFDDLVAVTTTSSAKGVIFLGQSMLHDEFNRLADANGNFVVWGAHLQGQKYRSVGSENLLGGSRAPPHLPIDRA